jgi:hypothetical protein
MTRDEVWLQAYCAYIASFNATAERGIVSADKCLAAYDERFAGPTSGMSAGTAATPKDGSGQSPPARPEGDAKVVPV